MNHATQLQRTVRAYRRARKAERRFARNITVLESSPRPRSCSAHTLDKRGPRASQHAAKVWNAHALARFAQASCNLSALYHQLQKEA